MEATENRANIPVSYFIYTSTSQNFTPHRCLPSLLAFILGLTTLSGGGGRKKKKQKSQCSSWSARLSRLARGTEGTSWQSASAHFLITLEPQRGSWGGGGRGRWLREEEMWSKHLWSAHRSTHLFLFQREWCGYSRRRCAAPSGWPIYWFLTKWYFVTFVALFFPSTFFWAECLSKKSLRQILRRGFEWVLSSRVLVRTPELTDTDLVLKRYRLGSLWGILFPAQLQVGLHRMLAITTRLLVHPCGLQPIRGSIN